MSRGGRRAGAGRKPGSKNKKPRQPRLLSNDVVVESDDVVASDALIDLMKKIAHDPNIDAQLRLDAAKAVAPYLIARIGARPPPADTTNSIGLMGPVQILSIPSGCFLSEEQIKNPDLLLKHAVPILFDNDDDADAVIDGEPDDVVA